MIEIGPNLQHALADLGFWVLAALCLWFVFGKDSA